MARQYTAVALTFALAMGINCIPGALSSPAGAFLEMLVAAATGAIAWSVVSRHGFPTPLRAALAGFAAMSLSWLLMVIMVPLSHLLGRLAFPHHYVHLSAQGALHKFLSVAGSDVTSPVTILLFLGGAYAGTVVRRWLLAGLTSSLFSLPPVLASALLLGLTAALTIAFRCIFTSMRPSEGAGLAALASLSTATITAILWPPRSLNPPFSIIVGALAGSLSVAFGLPLARLYSAVWSFFFWGNRYSLPGLMATSFSYLRYTGYLALILGAIAGGLLGASQNTSTSRA